MPVTTAAMGMTIQLLHRLVPMATTLITHIPARPMATTDRTGSLAASLSEPAHGTGGTGVAASTVAVDSMAGMAIVAA